jgi:hypothetical protein
MPKHYGDIPVRRPLRPPPKKVEKPLPPTPKLLAQRETTGKTNKDIQKLELKLKLKEVMNDLERM